MYTGVLVDGAAIFAGGLCGLLSGSRLPEQTRQLLSQLLGVVMVTGALVNLSAGLSIAVLALFLCGGALIGSVLRLEERLEALLEKTGSASTSAHGLSQSVLLVCPGAMAITGCLQAGLQGSNEILLAKALADFLMIFILASGTGFSAALGFLPCLVYEGLLVAGAAALEPFFTGWTLDYTIWISAVLMLLLGLNMMRLTSFPVLDLLPAAFLPLLVRLLLLLF